MSENNEDHPISEPFRDLQPIGSAPVAPAHGIAAIALSMAMKYCDISTVQDGALYQQYKLEGKNMTPLHLDHVFETAMKMEAYLLGANERISKLIVDTLEIAIKEDDPPGAKRKR